MWDRTVPGAGARALQVEFCRGLAVQEPTMNLRALPIPVGSPLVPHTGAEHSTHPHMHRQTRPGVAQLTWQG